MMTKARRFFGRGGAPKGPLSLTLCVFGCSGSAPDLPPGWEGAVRVTALEQSACGGSAFQGHREALEAEAAGSSMRVSYRHAHFRCGQSVEAFYRASAGAVDALVQPVDMDPAQIAKCDCLYEVRLSIPAAPGSYVLTLHRRWDHKSGADAPVQIASQSVVVP